MKLVKVQQNELEKNIFGKYKINKKDSTSWMLISITMIAVILSLIFFINAETQWENVLAYRWKLFTDNILNWTVTTWPQFTEMLYQMMITIFIALALTISTVIVSIPLSVFAAKNLFKGPVSTIVKTLSGIIRSIPTLIWTFMFIPVFGLNIKTAFIAMTFHGIAFYVKVFSETFEEVDPGINEALTATGANKMKIAYAAMIPASFKKIIGWALLRFEINIAIVVVLAPAVGVPNAIGYTLSSYIATYNYGQVGLIFFLIICTMLSIEKLSKWIMKKI